MARYQVQHRYASSTHGPWSEGDYIELEPQEAAWVNHDSAGTLEIVDPEEQARIKREKQALADAKRAEEQAAKEAAEAKKRDDAPVKRGPGRPRKDS